MAKSEAELDGVLSVAIADMAEIAGTALSGLGYAGINVNTQYRQATARERASEQYGGDRWDFEYRVLLKWETAQVGGVQITIVVSERQYSHQEYVCEERCRDVWQELKRNAEHIAEAKGKPSGLYGSAAWARPDELQAGGYFDPVKSDRFIVGRYGDQIVSVPGHLSDEHVLVCGPTGAGKTRTIFIPNLVKRLDISALVTEAASGENAAPLYTRTAGWRAAAGHVIHYFNPFDLTSTRINPLDAVQTFDQANHITNLIIRNTSLPNRFGGDQIWEQSETYLLNALILYTVGLRKGERAIVGDNANLAFIRALLREGPEEIGDLIKGSHIELARQEYSSFYKNTSPNFRYGVCSGLLVRLNPWVIPHVGALTEVTDFDAERLKEQLFTFYFVTSTKRPQLKPVAALAFNYVFDLLQTPGFRHPLTLFLDELTNYGYIPDLPDKLTHIRNQQIGAVLGIQHHIQLSKVYSDKDAQLLLTQPGTRIYFRPRDNDSALKISRSLGNMTVQQRKVLSSGAIQEDERQKPLLDPSEVERMPKSKIIVLTPTTNPVMADTFHPTEHDEFCQLPPPARKPLVIDERLVRREAETKNRSPQPSDRSQNKQTGTDSQGTGSEPATGGAKEQATGWDEKELSQPGRLDDDAEPEHGGWSDDEIA
jgi:type IV secretion system protein VirD4